MWSVGEALERFISSLELTEGQRSEVSRQHTLVREALSRRLAGCETSFLSGSYSRSTAIRPLHDIDIFTVVGRAASTPPETPDAALKRARKALHEEWSQKELPILQQHSVHLEFTTRDIEFDVVPAYQHPSQELFLIPEGDTGRWIRTNPRIHKELSTAANERAGKKLKPLIKAAKHWNRLHGSSPLRSFHLEVMSYEAFSRAPSGYLEGLETLFAFMAGRVERPSSDPAGLGGNVDERMTGGQRTAARNALQGAAREVRLALSERDARPEEAHKRLRKLFGEAYRYR
ncbi:nucleotidyltransferase [Myxococcus sp. AM009]|uniref:nucleotidyltransferase domain-containing protein n=1 Tax=Myxococcus sp. AM009 TaxID=2745137 RepID=UPI001594F592|nr:nucleotidyltransferase [Myxococcus sp. AM009]NVJ01160.1 nucleotidyltransferase [Myxococcus sp. AM009]